MEKSGRYPDIWDFAAMGCVFLLLDGPLILAALLVAAIVYDLVPVFRQAKRDLEFWAR